MKLTNDDLINNQTIRYFVINALVGKYKRDDFAEWHEKNLKDNKKIDVKLIINDKEFPLEETLQFIVDQFEEQVRKKAENLISDKLSQKILPIVNLMEELELKLQRELNN